MKILHISGSMPPLRCGVGFYANHLYNHMPSPFDLLTTSGLGDHTSATNNYKVPDWKIIRLPRLLKLCRAGKYDIIHIQFPAVGYKRELGINILPYLLRLFCRSKVVVTLHEYHGSGLLGKSRDFITVLPVKKIIVSNPYDMQALPKILRRKAVLIPISSSIPLSKPNPALFKEIMGRAGFDTKQKVVVYFGFPYPNKGVDIAIEAAVQSDIQLLLLTSFNEEDDYQKRLSDMAKIAIESGAKIYITGYLEDEEFSKIIQECNYFVLPQPLPLTAKSGTAITAALHGLIVISTASPNPELNLPYENGKNSILLEPMNAAALTVAIKAAPDKESLAPELQKLRVFFSWDSIKQKHEALYKDVIR